MLRAIIEPEKLDIPKLLAIYRESSLEDARKMFPEETDAAALEQYEEGYAAYMRDEFFSHPARFWMVEIADGLWVSSLRLVRRELERPDIWIVGGLETHPDHRRKGHASRLLGESIRFLEMIHGPVTLFSGVVKDNPASLQTHLHCGFVRESETWTEGGITSDRICTMTYRSPQGDRSSDTGAFSSSASGATRQS